MLLMNPRRSMGLVLLAMLAVGCGGEPDSYAEGSRSEGQRCTSLADCSGDLVCLQLGEEAATCAVQCTASVDACGASASCGPVGAVIDVCQPEESVASAENPPEEEDTPVLPCATDDECAVLHPDAVCASWRGAKSCSLLCNSDDTCNPPPVGGITTTFLTCDADEADSSRDVCVPNEACFNDPFSCVDMGDFPGF